MPDPDLKPYVPTKAELAAAVDAAAPRPQQVTLVPLATTDPSPSEWQRLEAEHTAEVRAMPTPKVRTVDDAMREMQRAQDERVARGLAAGRGRRVVIDHVGMVEQWNPGATVVEPLPPVPPPQM